MDVEGIQRVKDEGEGEDEGHSHRHCPREGSPHAASAGIAGANPPEIGLEVE